MAALWCSRRLLKRIPPLPLTRQSGYIVLIPEIGEIVNEKDNSLINKDGLAHFDDVTIERCVSSILRQSTALEDCIKNLETGKKISNIITDLIIPIENMEMPLVFTWGISNTLYMGNNSAMPTKLYKQIHQKANNAKTTKFNSKYIYDAVVEALETDQSFTDEEYRLLKKYQLESRLNGIALNETDSLLYNKYKVDMLREMAAFKDKNRIGFNQYSHTISNPEIVKDFPLNLLKNMSADPCEPTQGPWKITHQPNVYESFMEHCPNKTLRYTAWDSYIKVCSNRADRSIVTSIELEKIRFLRRLIANLLGYETYADMSMETKMAGSVNNVKKTISALLERARGIQDLEIERLEDFAHDNGQNDKLEHCDVEYWKREQRKQLYLFDEEEIRDFFPLPVVLQGLIELSSKLFDIKICERSKVSVWHEDVKFYEIFDSNSSTPIAGFYFDPYTRKDEKMGLGTDSGFMIPIRNRSTITGAQPLASLIFNFQAPIYGKPSLLSFKEVKSLFYKFGRALHHLLSEANYSNVSGLSNVEWDMVNVSGHVMVNWLYEPHVLKAISSHYTTHESLPSEMINNLNLVRKHMAGYDLCKELYKCSLDIELHSTKTFWREIVNNIWPKYHTIPYNQLDCHPCTFSQIVDGHWAAAYYSNIWSRMLASDIYSAFVEVNNDEEKVLAVGRRFRDTFFALGGTCHANEIFRRFRGRDPSHKSLLIDLGLKQTN